MPANSQSRSPKTAKSILLPIQRQPLQRALLQERKAQERTQSTQRKAQRETRKTEAAERQEESDVRGPQPHAPEQ